MPVPVEVEVHTLPYFKSPVNAKVGPGGLKCGPEHFYAVKQHYEFGLI